ncbi:MAG TPA: glutamate--tRNA ligase family protein [Thermoanaerobaculia bacterium]|nr:glutamate--tRNA ligase family protein [Thermoanaerobaculia bacterium]
MDSSDARSNLGPPRGRYAPSPTGPIHVGNARTALVAWLSVRSAGGVFVLRNEDLDAPRVVRGLAEEQRCDLEWLGLDWDEGPDRGGEHGPYEQGLRTRHYLEALRRLEARGRLFPCGLTRRELRGVASAPHGPESAPYPASLRPTGLEPRWLERLLASEDAGAAVRFRVDPVEVAWEDLVLGSMRERVDLEVGDFVLRRRDGLWAYQLAVVVDDLAMAIDEVVRGADLVGSTGRQILLFEALGGRAPRFGHVPLMVTPAGEKLSKRDQALTVAALRGAGLPPELVVGYLAYTLGLRDRIEGATPAELVGEHEWSRLLSGETIVPPDLAERLLQRRRVPRPSGHDAG